MAGRLIDQTGVPGSAYELPNIAQSPPVPIPRPNRDIMSRREVPYQVPQYAPSLNDPMYYQQAQQGPSPDPYVQPPGINATTQQTYLQNGYAPTGANSIWSNYQSPYQPSYGQNPALQSALPPLDRTQQSFEDMDLNDWLASQAVQPEETAGPFSPVSGQEGETAGPAHNPFTVPGVDGYTGGSYVAAANPNSLGPPPYVNKPYTPTEPPPGGTGWDVDNAGLDVLPWTSWGPTDNKTGGGFVGPPNPNTTKDNPLDMNVLNVVDGVATLAPITYEQWLASLFNNPNAARDRAYAEFAYNLTDAQQAQLQLPGPPGSPIIMTGTDGQLYYLPQGNYKEPNPLDNFWNSPGMQPWSPYNVDPPPPPNPFDPNGPTYFA